MELLVIDEEARLANLRNISSPKLENLRIEINIINAKVKENNIQYEKSFSE